MLGPNNLFVDLDKNHLKLWEKNTFETGAKWLTGHPEWRTYLIQRWANPDVKLGEIDRLAIEIMLSKSYGND